MTQTIKSECNLNINHEKNSKMECAHRTFNAKNNNTTNASQSHASHDDKRFQKQHVQIYITRNGCMISVNNFVTSNFKF